MCGLCGMDPVDGMRGLWMMDGVGGMCEGAQRVWNVLTWSGRPGPASPAGPAGLATRAGPLRVPGGVPPPPPSAPVSPSPDQTRPDALTRPDLTRPDKTRQDQTRPDQSIITSSLRLLKPGLALFSARNARNARNAPTDPCVLCVPGGWGGSPHPLWPMLTRDKH
eukprot:gene13411-biopygen15581